MKFAIINDMHIGPLTGGFSQGVQRKLIFESERLVKEFVEKMNNEERPEFVVNLGDSVEDVNNREIDRTSFKKAISLLSGLQMPIYFLIGNHDVRTLSDQDITTILGYEKMHYSFDHDAFHFVALSFEMTGEHTKVLSDIRAEVPREQLMWLTEDLSKTSKPTIVFIHYGLAEDDMKGNFWFESNPHNALLGNREEVRKILEESGKVKAVFNAHQHWNRMHVHNSIPYFTVTSLVENTKNDGIPAEAWTIVNLDENKIEVNIKGNDPVNFDYSFK